MFCKWNISASKTAIVPWQTSAGFICSLKPLLWKKCAVSCFIWNTQGNKNRRQGHVISSQRWYRWRRFSFGENNSTTLMFFIFFSPYLSRWNHKREKQFLSFSILILQMKDFAQLKSSFDCTSKKIYCTVFKTSTVSILAALWTFRKFYHDRDVQDPELLLCRIVGWVFSWFWKAEAAVLVVDVEEQSAILKPLLPPAHQRDVFWITRYLCQIKKGTWMRGSLLLQHKFHSTDCQHHEVDQLEFEYFTREDRHRPRSLTHH